MLGLGERESLRAASVCMDSPGLSALKFRLVCIDLVPGDFVACLANVGCLFFCFVFLNGYW